LYVGAHVEERYNIIEDGAIDQQVEGQDGVTPEQQQTRAEQSDLVMILLNLAYIPDSVIHKLENFKIGWQKQFKALMTSHNESEVFSRWN